jgi:hypothetical protein
VATLFVTVNESTVPQGACPALCLHCLAADPNRPVAQQPLGFTVQFDPCGLLSDGAVGSHPSLVSNVHGAVFGGLVGSELALCRQHSPPARWQQGVRAKSTSFGLLLAAGPCSHLPFAVSCLCLATAH